MPENNPAPVIPSAIGEPLRFIAQGESAKLYDLGDGRAIKLFQPSVSEEMIAREADASAHARSCGLPAAAALERRDRDGQRGIIYPLVSGQTLMGWIRRHPARAGQALDQMADIHRTMHRAPGGPLRSLKQVLATDIAYGPAPAAVQEAALAYIDTLPDADRLTHGDFHIGNIMMTPQGLMVIDWSKAAAGHPAADAVRSEMLMRFGVGPSDWITNIWRDWAAGRLRRAYLASATVTGDDLARWRPIVALAWLRARNAGRSAAFRAYLNRAMAKAGLPPVAL